MNIQTARTTSAESALLRENSGPVAVLTLNRPAARNSLSEALLAVLGDELAVFRRIPAYAPWCSPRMGPPSAPDTISRS